MKPTDVLPYVPAITSALVYVTCVLIVRKRNLENRAFLKKCQDRILEIRRSSDSLACDYWSTLLDVRREVAGELSLLLGYAEAAGDVEIAAAVRSKLSENASIIESTIEPCLDTARARLLIAESELTSST